MNYFNVGNNNTRAFIRRNAGLVCTDFAEERLKREQSSALF